MNVKLKEKILESLSAVLSITGIVLLITILLVPIDLGIMVMFIVGAVMLVVGMGFFQLGGGRYVHDAFGIGIGVQISRTRRISFIVLIGLSMGFIITISEPDFQVLAEQVPAIPNLLLILTVAGGVAFASGRVATGPMTVPFIMAMGAKEMLKKLRKQLHFGMPNSGVAFTVAMSGGSYEVLGDSCSAGAGSFNYTCQ